jgi:hypothetical protein
MRKAWTAVIAGVLLISAPTIARADPLRITGGGYFADFEGDFFQFLAPGFDATTTSVGVFPPKIFRGGDRLCLPCRPGDPVDLSFRTAGRVSLGTGHITSLSNRFDNVTFSGSFNFNVAPLPFASDGGPFVLFEAPFTFSGFLSAQFPGNVGTGEIFARLSGTGIASTTFVIGNEKDVYLPELLRISYLFNTETAPIPEPSTFLLLGTGVAALGRARWRRRAQA